MMKRFATIAAIAMATVAAPAMADTTIGTNQGGNCYPFSCFAGEYAGGGGSLYQQVYNASAFTGPLTIGSVSFAKSQGGLMDNATYNVSFYLSPNSSKTLSTNAAANRGTLLADFGAFSLSGMMPDTLSFDGTRFNYDPTLGNLLMQVSVTGLTQRAGYDSFFQADYSTGQTARLYQYANGQSYVASGALVTTFGLGTGAGAVPEPATWAMMIGGFGMVGGTLRRRKATLRFA